MDKSEMLKKQKQKIGYNSYSWNGPVGGGA